MYNEETSIRFNNKIYIGSSGSRSSLEVHVGLLVWKLEKCVNESKEILDKKLKKTMGIRKSSELQSGHGHGYVHIKFYYTYMWKILC